MKRGAAILKNDSRLAIEDHRRFLANLIDAYARDPADHRAQQKALAGRRLFGEDLVHFGGGGQHQKCKAVGRRVAVEIGKILRAIVGGFDLQRKLRYLVDKNAALRQQATLIGHKVGDGSAHPVAPRKLAERLTAAGQEQGFTGGNSRLHFSNGLQCGTDSCKHGPLSLLIRESWQIQR